MAYDRFAPHRRGSRAHLISRATRRRGAAAAALWAALALSSAARADEGAARLGLGIPVVDPPAAWLDPAAPAPHAALAGAWNMAAPPLSVLLSSEPSVEPREKRLRFALGIHGSLDGASAPTLSPAISLFADVWYRTGEVFSPSLRVWFSHARSSTTPLGIAGARFQLTKGRLDVCPVDLPLFAGAGITPCATYELGVLHAEADYDRDAPSDYIERTRPWSTPGLLGRFHIEPTDWLRIEVQGGAMFPTVRDLYYYVPSTATFKIPAVGGFFGAGAGVSFP
ncbi:hypothetical protein WME99_05075 [Sorangium sp. So ce136]|uniref:hypothetical protein n=1 Tax=Sorangium sp. So ce136 TaxID=3133284 RepID=UPI003F12BC90